VSSEPSRPLRHERRAAALAMKRVPPRPAAGRPRRIGIGTVSVLAVGLGAVVVAAILLFGRTSGSATPAVVGTAAPAGIATAGHVLGDAGAPVTIDLYEDFQCPACEAWGRNVFPSLARNELAAGTVRIVYHGFAFIGPESQSAGRAAWAAEQQGRFWDMWATLYANQGLHENGGSFSRARLLAMADVIGLDPARFAADLDSAAAATAVSDGLAAAAAAGVSSTPTLVVNGTPLTGAAYPDLAAVVAAAAR
jgi:protein-disulfide isomerase